MLLNFLGRYKANVPEGENGGAEITAYDPQTKRLYVVNAFNNAIDILNLDDPTNPVFVSSIEIDDAMGIGVNSVAVKNSIVAVAIANDPKEEPGKKV